MNSHDDEAMSMVWKVAIGLVIAVMLPVAAYAVGNVTAPNDATVPRDEIVIDDAPSPTKASDDPARLSKAEREARERRRARLEKKRDAREDRDDVKVVTPQPTPVNGGAGNGGAGNDDARDDEGDDGDDRDDDDDDGGDDDDDDDDGGDDDGGDD